MTTQDIKKLEKIEGANPVVKRRGQKTLLLVLLLFFGLAAASGAALYFYKKFTKLKQGPGALSRQETEDLVKRVSKLIILPTDEAPTIATVSDPEQLKDQPFFARAKAGDKVLIYTNAKKAILYDPVANKIVEVAPLNLGEVAKQNSTTTRP
jgi:hypothetical protein